MGRFDAFIEYALGSLLLWGRRRWSYFLVLGRELDCDIFCLSHHRDHAIIAGMDREKNMIFRVEYEEQIKALEQPIEDLKNEVNCGKQKAQDPPERGTFLSSYLSKQKLF